jgi:hypothetical protein
VRSAFLDKNQRRPFFLYFRAARPARAARAAPALRGKTGMGPRGDAIVQADWCVGEMLEALERLKLANNTAGAVHERQRPRRGRRL